MTYKTESLGASSQGPLCREICIPAAHSDTWPQPRARGSWGWRTPSGTKLQWLLLEDVQAFKPTLSRWLCCHSATRRAAPGWFWKGRALLGKGNSRQTCSVLRGPTWQEPRCVGPVRTLAGGQQLGGGRRGFRIQEAADTRQGPAPRGSHQEQAVIHSLFIQFNSEQLF